MLTKTRTAAATLIVLQALLLWTCPIALAQQPAPRGKSYTLDEAIRYALANYPAVRASMERVTAARAGVTLARTNYLPQFNSLWQSNRATDNNITGLLLPQPYLPSISGPVPLATSFRSAWGSVGGVLFTWEAYDFGLRRAQVDQARSAVNQASAVAALTQLQVAVGVAEAFMTALADQQSVKAAQANLQRREVFAKTVHVLVDNQLRPGADAARADAELAAARILLVQAQGEEQAARALLAALLGEAGTPVAIAPGPLLTLPGESALPSAEIASHPEALSEQANVEQLREQQRTLSRTDLPHIYFQSSAYGRGSGIGPTGTFAGGANGLGLDRANWAAGITVLFPNLFDFSALRARKRALAANERAQEARYDQTLQDLTGQLGQAQARLQTALLVAQNTPVELAAARASETQARARYQAGLANIVEIADAQSLLTQAEITDAISRVGAWRGFLGVASAQGDLAPFLQILAQTPAGGY